MLKFIFWSLLCINGVLLAYSQGMLGYSNDNEREPARMRNQLNANKLVLVPANGPVAHDADCIEIGDFALLEAERFEARIAPLALGDRQSRRNVVAPGPSSHIVYIASLGSQEAAERKARELKALGVRDYYIITEDSPMKWAISLGVFKSETAAQALLATLGKQGVHSAKLGVRDTPVYKVAFQLHALDAAARQNVNDIASSFAALETRSCKSFGCEPGLRTGAANRGCEPGSDPQRKHRGLTPLLGLTPLPGLTR